MSSPPFQTYVDYMSRLYEREIKDFFEVAKIKMAGTSKEAKGKFGKCLVELLCGIRISLRASSFLFELNPKGKRLDFLSSLCHTTTHDVMASLPTNRKQHLYLLEYFLCYNCQKEYLATVVVLCSVFKIRLGFLVLAESSAFSVKALSC